MDEAAKMITSAELLPNIDASVWPELEAQQLLQAPYPFVLDTEFFFSAFQSQLKYGGPPKSLQAAMEGIIHFFMAKDTYIELRYNKLPDFAAELRTTVPVLEGCLSSWLDWLTIVPIPTQYSDARIAQLAERDASDVPTAILACLLAPCVLLTNDLDFETLIEGLKSRPHVTIVKAAWQLNQASGELQVIIAMPTWPITVAIGLIRWVATRLNLSPWLVGGLLTLVAVLTGRWAYRRMDDDDKTKFRETSVEVGGRYLEKVAEIHQRREGARKLLGKRTVLPSGPRSREQIVLRALAMAEEPLSAQRLWERLDSDDRPSVGKVRETLRKHPSAVGHGGGLWTFGLSASKTAGLAWQPAITPPPMLQAEFHNPANDAAVNSQLGPSLMPFEQDG